MATTTQTSPTPSNKQALTATFLLRVRHKPAIHQQAYHPPTSRPPTSTTLWQCAPKYISAWDVIDQRAPYFGWSWPGDMEAAVAAHHNTASPILPPHHGPHPLQCVGYLLKNCHPHASMYSNILQLEWYVECSLYVLTQIYFCVVRCDFSTGI